MACNLKRNPWRQKSNVERPIKGGSCRPCLRGSHDLAALSGRMLVKHGLLLCVCIYIFISPLKACVNQNSHARPLMPLWVTNQIYKAACMCHRYSIWCLIYSRLAFDYTTWGLESFVRSPQQSLPTLQSAQGLLRVKRAEAQPALVRGSRRETQLQSQSTFHRSLPESW